MKWMNSYVDILTLDAWIDAKTLLDARVDELIFEDAHTCARVDY